MTGVLLCAGANRTPVRNQRLHTNTPHNIAEVTVYALEETVAKAYRRQ